MWVFVFRSFFILLKIFLVLFMLIRLELLYFVGFGGGGVEMKEMFLVWFVFLFWEFGKGLF